MLASHPHPSSPLSVSDQGVSFAELREAGRCDNNAVESSLLRFSSPRSGILALGSEIGNLCHQTLSHAPFDKNNENNNENYDESNESNSCKSSFWSQPSPQREDIYAAISRVFASLVLLANACTRSIGTDDHQSTRCIDLQIAILKKVSLNAKKYPVELCKGKSGKYTQYTATTGISGSFADQSTIDIDINKSATQVNESVSSMVDEIGDMNMSGIEDEHEDNGIRIGGDDINLSIDISTSTHKSQHAQSPVSSMEKTPVTVSGMMAMIQQFALARKWNVYHQPRNIILAMMGEVGELAELFQWKGDDEHGNESAINDSCIMDGWKEEDIDHVQQELADVAIYCLRLADVVELHDLGKRTLDALRC